jgi:TonB family protein
MEAVVSDIIRSRMREPGGLKQTAVVSAALHVGVFALLLAVPGVLGPKDVTPPVVMNISLGGSPGPRTGGEMMIGGRAIQPSQPMAAPRLAPRPEPKMVVPIPDPKMKPKAPAAKSPARGAQPQAGNTPVDTGAKGMGFGLSSAGGGGTGGYLDVQNFCCPEYLQDMVDRIRSKWNQQQQATGTVQMKYTILRNGTITGIEVERPSNFPALDIESQRALTYTQKLAPLPAAFPDDHLTVHLMFQYERKR